jgi:hypothetical protein
VATLERKTDLAHIAVVALIIVPLFAFTGRWGVPGNPDAFAAALPAWQVATHGTLDLSSHPTIVSNLDSFDRWFVVGESGAIISNRPPGLIGLAIPAYLLFRSQSFSNNPAVLVALLATTLSLLVLWKILKGLVGRNLASAAVVVVALGTTTWSVSASELWPHGPGQLWASLTLLALSGGGYLVAGSWAGLAILTRPLTGVFAFVTGIAESIRSRKWRPALQIGLTSSLGLALLLIYNRVIFGHWNVTGGYGSQFAGDALGRFRLGSYLVNLGDMMIGPVHGVLVTSPILGAAAIGAALSWRSMPGWVRSSAVASVAYLLVHAMLNRASGGMAFFYRYPLEAITFAAPALVLGAKALIDRGDIGRKIVIVTVVISVLLQILQVFYLTCLHTDPVFRTCLLSW